MTDETTPPAKSNGKAEDKPEGKPIEKPKATLNGGLTEPKAPLNEGLKKPKVEPKEWPKLDRDVRCPHCDETVRPLIVTSEERGTRHHCPNCKWIIPESKIGQPKEGEDKGAKESIVKRERKPKEILSDILNRHPDLNSKHAAYIMDAVKEIEVPHPYEIWWYLNNLRGVDRKTAEMVMYQYQSAIQPLGREPSVPPPMAGRQQQVPIPPWMAPWQMPQYNPYNPMTPWVPMQQQPVQTSPTPYNPQLPPQGGSRGVDGGMSEEKILKLLENHEREVEERKKGDMLTQTLNGVRQALDNLHGRVSIIEQGGVPGKHSEKAGNPLQDQINLALGKRLSSVILGEEEPSLEKLKAVAKEIRGSAPALAPGSRSEYDMRVEQAQHEAEARKIEAQEKRKGYEAIATGIRDGLQGLGFNVGAGLSVGPPGVSPAQSQLGIMEPSEPQLPIRGTDGQLYVECSRCHTHLMIPEGQARVVCPSCSGIVNVMTREEATRANEARRVGMPAAEGLKQKVSLEKRTETRAELKKEEPEHEEPQREEPQREEEEPPSAGEPAGAVSSDINAAKKVEGVAT